MLLGEKLPLLTNLYTRARALPPEPKRFVKFLFVGGLGFIIDFGTFNLVHYLYNVPDTHTDEVIAQALSFSVAVFCNFLWNIFWIYPGARTKSVPQKIVMFIIVSVLSLVIRTPIFTLTLPLTTRLVAAAGLDQLPINLGNNLALATAVIVVMLWNFFVNRYWTYRDVV
jgi:putative flippase GtrA